MLLQPRHPALLPGIPNKITLFFILKLDDAEPLYHLLRDYFFLCLGFLSHNNCNNLRGTFLVSTYSKGQAGHCSIFYYIAAHRIPKTHLALPS